MRQPFPFTISFDYVGGLNVPLCRAPRIRTVLLLLVAVSASAVTPSSGVGVSLIGLNSNPADRVKLASELGASWYRPDPVLLGATPTCDDCDPARAAGLKLLLVIRNSAASSKPSDPVKDIAAFQQKLRSVFERFKPDLLVVETEPDDTKSFAGSPDEYAAELKLACELSHSARIPCADGGLSSPTVIALVTDERWKTDQIDATNFAFSTEAARTGRNQSLSVFGKSIKDPNVAQAEERIKLLNATEKYMTANAERISRARALITASNASGADYLNFHWYELIPENIPKVADTLHLLSKRLLMTDGLGQRNDRPFETGEKLKQALDNFIRPVIWSGVDGPDERIGLVDKKGKLRSNAAAFQRIAKQSQNPQ
jgi:hypothetical protein